MGTEAGKRGCYQSWAVTSHQPRPTRDSWGLLISSPSASVFPHQMPAQAPLAAGTREARLLLLADNAIKKQIKRETTNWIHRSLQCPDREEQGTDIISSSQPPASDSELGENHFSDLFVFMNKPCPTRMFPCTSPTHGDTTRAQTRPRTGSHLLNTAEPHRLPEAHGKTV